MRLHHRWAISAASHREPPHPSPLPNLNNPIEKGPLQRWWSLGFLSRFLPACCTHDSSFGVQIFCALQNAKLRQPAREYSTSGHAHFAQCARVLSHTPHHIGAQAMLSRSANIVRTDRRCGRSPDISRVISICFLLAAAERLRTGLFDRVCLL